MKTKIYWIVTALTLLCLAACVKNHQVGGVDTIYTRNGKKVVITCIKHASLQINYDGYEFEIDPVSSAYRPIINYTEKPKADYILVTHEHYDHFDMNAIFLLTKNATNILLTPRCFGRYQRGVIIRNNEKADLGHGMTLYAVPAYNITPRYRYLHPKGVGNGYILDLEGFRIYIAGDTEFIPEMHKIKNIDVAFLPCDQPKTMTIAQFRKAAATIRPKILYPYHRGLTDTTKIIRATRGLGIDVRIRYLK
jgi:L-ascorbate metabolism protein UlaG (beta-lactamase superfamily)